jgi:hypothetical protein
MAWRVCADLNVMGGVHAVLRHTSSEDDAVVAAAFWTLGTAAANNPTAQVLPATITQPQGFQG